MTTRKVAVLSMDVEDWYHLDYLDRSACDCSCSLLDGVEEFSRILSAEGIKATYFVLGELAERLGCTLRNLIQEGHDVASHGWDHRRPLRMKVEDFAADLRRSKAELERVVGRPVTGYRAPCLSMDRERLDLVNKAGYRYDSSRILFEQHPLYGTIEMGGFDRVSENVFRQDDFFEFQVSTLRAVGRNIPVSGGGYLRILPWFLMKRWIRSYLAGHELYVFYIHPFELSRLSLPLLPSGVKLRNRFRFSYGRSRVSDRFRELIHMLKVEQFEFATFAELQTQLSGGLDRTT